MAFSSQGDDWDQERALVLAVLTKERPLGAKLYPGWIEDMMGARSQLDEEGAVSVPVIRQRVVLHLEDTHNLDLVRWRSVNTALARPFSFHLRPEYPPDRYHCRTGDRVT
jgi:hypothetical protein